MSAASKVRARRGPGAKRAQPTRATKKQRTKTAVRLVPTSISLVDLGPGADVSIRFPATGPVVDILNVRWVPAAWVSELLAPVVAGLWSKRCREQTATRSPRP
jgi:hypothetical protein